MTDELREEIEQLDAEYHKLTKKCLQAKLKRDEARERLRIEELKKIDEHIPQYIKRLERLKKIIEAFVLQYTRNGHVEYAFKKVEHYTNDWHDPTHDPLNWMIQEYDLLEMSNHMEIVFEYATESVREFVDKWMKENVEYASERDLESLFLPILK